MLCPYKPPFRSGHSWSPAALGRGRPKAQEPMCDEGTPSEEDREACRVAYGYALDNRKCRYGFLEELYRSEHTQEATLLCLCYIDELAALGWPEIEGSKRRFVDVLTGYGGDEALGEIRPGHLLKAFLGDRAPKRLKALAPKIEAAIGYSGRLHSPEEIVELVKPHITTDELNLLKKELWRGSLAAAAYDVLRCPAVHEFSAYDGIRFERGDSPGEVERLDFRMLYGFLQRLLPIAWQRFLEREGL